MVYTSYTIVHSGSVARACGGGACEATITWESHQGASNATSGRSRFGGGTTTTKTNNTNTNQTKRLRSWSNNACWLGIKTFTEYEPHRGSYRKRTNLHRGQDWNWKGRDSSYIISYVVNSYAYPLAARDVAKGCVCFNLNVGDRRPSAK